MVIDRAVDRTGFDIGRNDNGRDSHSEAREIKGRHIRNLRTWIRRDFPIGVDSGRRHHVIRRVSSSLRHPAGEFTDFPALSFRLEEPAC